MRSRLMILVAFVALCVFGASGHADETATKDQIKALVLEINEALEDEPEKVNADCYGEGWLILVRLDDAAQLDALLDASAYQAFIDGRESDA